VQHRRFEIVEDYGCQAAVYPSILTIILIWLPPLFLCTITIVYLGRSLLTTLLLISAQFPPSGLVLYHTMAISRLSSFADHLENRSPLNMSRFARSAAVCTLFAVFVASLSVISISSAVAAGLSPWNSFGEVHSNYFDIVIISSLDFRSQAHLRATISWGWWMIPILSFVFFGLSACSRGSAKDYRAFGKWVWRKVSGKRDSDAKAHQSSLIPMQ
jgi:pheromone a factor receptor